MSVDWVAREGSLEREEIKNETIARHKRQKIDSCTDLTVKQSFLGLALNKTQYFLDFINWKLSHEEITPLDEPTTSTTMEKQKTKDDKYNIQLASTKLKASNFPATKLKIGTWERMSKNEGDIVAKFYYAKQKLVWEILENGLKQKLEIQWADILAIRAHFTEQRPDTLEVELRQQPMFFNEVNPQPRKHTNWEACSDFTKGNATKHRRHNLEFPEGTLQKHYEKLLNADKQLLKLSQRDLTSNNSPFFETIDNEMHDTYMIKPKFSPTFHQPSSNWYLPYLHDVNNQRSLNAPIHFGTFESLDPLVRDRYPLPLLKPTIGAIQMNSSCSGQGLNHLEQSIPCPMPVYQSILNHPIQPHTVPNIGRGFLLNLTSTSPDQCNMYYTKPSQSSTTMEFMPAMDQATIASNLGTSCLADNFATNSGNSTMKPIPNSMSNFYNQDLENLKRVDDTREHQFYQPHSGAYTTPAPNVETEYSGLCINDLQSIEDSLFSELGDLDAFDSYDSRLCSKSFWSCLAEAELPDSQSQPSNGLGDCNQKIDGTNSPLELRDSNQFDNNEQIDASGLFQMSDPVASLQWN